MKFFKSTLMIFICALLVLMPVIGCNIGGRVYYESIISMGTSASIAVDKYEAVAVNLRKIYKGIEIICSERTQECVVIKQLYNETVDKFKKKGDALIRLLTEQKEERETSEAQQEYAVADAEFSALYKQLKIKAKEFGIGGIDHD